MASYSAFFSSGLLAPPHGKELYYPVSKFCATIQGNHPSSPARPSSPMCASEDTDIDIDVDSDAEMDRGTTPTRTNPNRTHKKSLTKPTTTTTQNNQQPRLRKRRSSLTVGASPMNAIRSPARAAAGALNLQRHLAAAAVASPPPSSRARSGSVGTTGIGIGLNLFAGIRANNVASENTSLLGRMRSGSVGGAVSALFKPRRHVRRLSSVPAPAPPPSAPLPSLPPSAPLTNSNLTFNTNPHVDDIHTIKGRSRGFSISSALTIDEEMKEN